MKNILFLALVFLGAFIFLSSCQKEMSTETGVVDIAEGSLTDSVGICTPGTVHGTFYNGITPGRDTAYVQIQVNVTKTGSYSISSNFQNGYEFADSGFFTTTGLNTVLLKPVGTPIIPTTSLFSVMFDSSLCNFTVSVQDSTGTGIHSGGDTVINGDPDANGGWQFTTSDGTFQGAFDTAVVIKDTSIWGSGGQMLVLEGFKTNTSDSAIALYLYLPTGTIVPGIYNTQLEPPSNAGLFAFVKFDLTTGDGDAIYEASTGTTSTTNTTITISSYNSTTRVVTGTFSGTAERNGNGTTNITNGSFTATVSP